MHRQIVSIISTRNGQHPPSEHRKKGKEKKRRREKRAKLKEEGLKDQERHDDRKRARISAGISLVGIHLVENRV